MGLLSMIGNGIGRLGQGITNLPNSLGATLFPVDQITSAGMDPAQLTQLRRAALLRTGLGLSGATAQGQGIGAAALAGINAGSEPFQQALETSFRNSQAKKADTRYEADRTYKMEQDKLEHDRQTAQDAALATYRDQQISAGKAQLEAENAWHKRSDETTRIGQTDDLARAKRQADQDAQVKAIYDQSVKEKRPLTTDELRTIQVLRGGSLSSTLFDQMAALLGNMNPGIPGAMPAPAVAPVDALIEQRRKAAAAAAAAAQGGSGATGHY